MILENEFTILLDQFKYLNSASSLLGTDYLDKKEMLIYGEITPYYDVKTNQQNAGDDSAELEKVITNINKSFSITNDPDITSVLSEIEKNLFFLHQNKESQILYSKNILRKFLRILPYIDITDNLEYNAKQARLTEEQLENAKKSINFLCYASHHRAAFNFLEKYISNMMLLLWTFSDGLHSVLLKLGISLIDLQNDLGIHILGRVSHRYLESENFTDTEINKIAGPELTTKDVALALIHFLDQNIQEPNVYNKETTESENENRDNRIALKSFFKNEEAFDKLMDFMTSENFILKGKTGLIWKGYSYKFASFFNALQSEGFLKSNNLSDSELAEIAEKTFYQFKVTGRNLRNKNFVSFIKEYQEILSRFNQNFPNLPQKTSKTS